MWMTPYPIADNVEVAKAQHYEKRKDYLNQKVLELSHQFHSPKEALDYILEIERLVEENLKGANQ